MSEVLKRAFDDFGHELSQHLEPEHLQSPDPQTRYRLSAHRWLPAFHAGTEAFFKAIDANGKIVGASRWGLPGKNLAASIPKKADADKTEEDRLCEQAYNLELTDRFDNATSVEKSRTLGDQLYFSLKTLAVHPDYQKRGIAGQLLQWGLDQADDQNLPIWLSATDAGRGLYTKHGFKQVGEIVIPDPAAKTGAFFRRGLCSLLSCFCRRVSNAVLSSTCEG